MWVSSFEEDPLTTLRAKKRSSEAGKKIKVRGCQIGRFADGDPDADKGLMDKIKDKLTG